MIGRIIINNKYIARSILFVTILVILAFAGNVNAIESIFSYIPIVNNQSDNSSYLTPTSTSGNIGSTPPKTTEPPPTSTSTPTQTPTPSPGPIPNVYINGFNPSTNPQNDYVIITNGSTNPVDMTDWWLKEDSLSGQYDFPIGYFLGAGNTVNLRRGVGTDTANNLYIGL